MTAQRGWFETAESAQLLHRLQQEDPFDQRSRSERQRHLPHLRLPDLRRLPQLPSQPTQSKSEQIERSIDAAGRHQRLLYQLLEAQVVERLSLPWRQAVEAQAAD